MAAAVAALSLAACQKEFIYVDDNGNPVELLKPGEGVISLGIVNAGLGTKAARPVGSSEAANNVSQVELIAFRSDAQDGAYTKDETVTLKDGEGKMIVAWSGTSGNTHEGHTDQEKTVKVQGLQAGKWYKFIAVGYNGESNPYGDYAGTDDKLQTVTEKTAYLGAGAVEELFAGTSVKIQASESANFKSDVSVRLTRQVAGMLGYFHKVPAEVDGTAVTFVKVYASAQYKLFTYPHVNKVDDFAGYNGVASSKVEGESEVLSFPVSTLQTGTDENGFYTFGEAPYATGYTAPEGLKLKENSIFGGCYLIPYGEDLAGQTLTVKICGGTSGETVLKTFKVTSGTGVEKKYDFDILCNNFYSLGKKIDTDTDNGGGEPEDPDTPIDLSGNTDIVVTICDQWDVLHNLGIEE